MQSSAFFLSISMVMRNAQYDSKSSSALMCLVKLLKRFIPLPEALKFSLMPEQVHFTAACIHSPSRLSEERSDSSIWTFQIESGPLLGQWLSVDFRPTRPGPSIAIIENDGMYPEHVSIIYSGCQREFQAICFAAYSEINFMLSAEIVLRKTTPIPGLQPYTVEKFVCKSFSLERTPEHAVLQ